MFGGTNKRLPILSGSRFGVLSSGGKYYAEVNWLADLIPHAPLVVSGRYAEHKRDVTAVSVGAAVISLLTFKALAAAAAGSLHAWKYFSAYESSG